MLADSSCPAPCAQVSTLSTLQELVLLRQLVADAGDGSLQQLRSLTALRMSGFTSRPPTCLGQLTQLRSVRLTRPPGDTHLSAADAEALSAALPALQQLTHLALELVLPCPPASLTSLWRLRSFGFLSYEQPPSAEDPGSLPGGTYLTALRRLAGTCAFLTASLPALAVASQLQELAILEVADSQQQAALGILRWAARLPAVCRVQLECVETDSMRQAATVARQLLPFTVEVQELGADWAGQHDWGPIFPDLPAVPEWPPS